AFPIHLLVNRPARVVEGPVERVREGDTKGVHVHGDRARTGDATVRNDEETVAIGRGEDARAEIETDGISHQRDQLLAADAGALLKAEITGQRDAQGAERDAGAVDLEIRSERNVDDHG